MFQKLQLLIVLSFFSSKERQLRMFALPTEDAIE